MLRIARVAAPGFPHRVTQRGNRRQKTFFSDEDYRTYLDMMAEWCGRQTVSVWAYCLMPNHVHLVAIPESESGLRRAIGKAHRRYTVRVNSREVWRGHLWQGRSASVVLQEEHLLAAVRYVERNLVRAVLVTEAEECPWSRATAHGSGRDDLLVKVAPMLERIGDWVEYLAATETKRFSRRYGATSGRDACWASSPSLRHSIPHSPTRSDRENLDRDPERTGMVSSEYAK